MTDALRIKNSNLDSNAWVILRGTTWKPTYGKRNAINPKDGKVTGSTQYDIAKADKMGIENPVFTITGVLNTYDYSVKADFLNITPSTNTSVAEGEGAGSMQGVVTLGYLISLWRDVTGVTLLEINLGNPTDQIKWPAYDLSTDGITVAIDTFDFNPRTDSEGRHFIEFTMAVSEVKPD